jgi:hypothetical protein
MGIMKSNTLKRKFAVALIVFFAGFLTHAFSQLPASLEKELLMFNSDIYEALKIIDTQNENEAVAKLSTLKPQLIQSATSLSAKLSKLPDLSEAEDDAWVERMMEKQELTDMLALVSNTAFLKKIENSQVLQKEFEELMAIMDLGMSSQEEEASLSGSQVCSFTVGTGSPNSGTYIVSAQEDQAFAYKDIANEQFVIEMHGDNYIDVMLIIEKPVLGKHTFTMEMQVAIDVSKNEGEDYFGFDNHQEEGGGQIQIDRIDDLGGIVSGSFSGQFNDSSTDDDRPVNIEGRFSVVRMQN